MTIDDIRQHGTDMATDPVIREALWKQAIKGELPCAVAFDVAKHLDVSPEAVGRTADLMEIKLVKCQLGLFGYHHKKSIVKPVSSVAPGLKKAISQALINGRLPCKHAWEIAGTLGIQKIKVGAACDSLEIKIRPCQLEAF